MGWFKKKKKKKKQEEDPAYTYYGDKKPTLAEQVAALLEDDRFVGIVKAGSKQYKVTIRVWRGVSIQNMSYTESLERVMHWAGATLERETNGTRKIK